MLQKYLSQKITEKLSFEPTASQLILIEKLAGFILSESEDQILLLKGYAGTGKTSVISAMVKVLEDSKRMVFLLAPTGRAAKVLSLYSEKQAYTIHKKIYRRKSNFDGADAFELNVNLHTNSFFIVDEASMISNSGYESTIFGSGRLLDDLIRFVYSTKKCKLILIGDTAQLPPVGSNVSPALEMNTLSSYHKTIDEVILTDVIRQAQDSGILFNATMIRNLLDRINLENEEVSVPKLKLKPFKDIKLLSGEDLIEEISSSYDKIGIENTIVVCRSNKRANKYNQGIRNSILWREEEISTGDLLMIVKNNYFWIQDNEQIDFIANGDIVEIIKIYRYHNRYDMRFADVRVRFKDYNNIEIDTKIILDTLNIETASLSSEAMQTFFYNVAEDFQDIASKKSRFQKIREDHFFNALQVKFAYAVTCHKAQGGQWPTVFIDHYYMTPEMVDIDYLRWLYTAITRAQQKLYFVNFKEDFILAENS